MVLQHQYVQPLRKQKHIFVMAIYEHIIRLNHSGNLQKLLQHYKIQQSGQSPLKTALLSCK